VKAATDLSSDSALSGPVPSALAQWVVFGLDEYRYALPLRAVDRFVRAAYVTPLPSAPPIVLGILNIAGQVLPVFNVRRKFRLSEREIRPEDQFLIARNAQRTVVLAVDSAHGVLELAASVPVDAATLIADCGHIRGVIPLEDGLVLIHDLDLLLSPDETRALDEALKQDESRAV
jgi:purine-binding chemotaxis protein CheW